MTSTGYSCGICKVKAHKSCVSNIVVGCKWNTLNSIEEKSYTFENVSSICHHDIINFWSPIPLLVTFSKKKVPKSFSHSLHYKIFSALFNVLPFGVFGLKLSYVAQISSSVGTYVHNFMIPDQSYREITTCITNGWKEIYQLVQDVQSVTNHVDPSSGKDKKSINELRKKKSNTFSTIHFQITRLAMPLVPNNCAYNLQR